MMVIKCYLAIIETGDMAKFNLLLDRLVGKVKDEVDLNLKPYVIKRLDGSSVELGAMRESEDE